MLTDVSEETVDRARSAKVELLESDLQLVQQCSVILSVVPPRDAESTAQRVIDALSGGSGSSKETYFADLNAVSPSTARSIASSFSKARVPVRFIDGCIIGGPPRPKDSPGAGTNVTASLDGPSSDWARPRVPMSGPHDFSALPTGDKLTTVLNMRSISQDIGSASGLKMCFAALTKGYTAIATQSFVTAQRLGVAADLREEMSQLIPAHLAASEKGVPSMVPKAYRWVREMEEIAATMSEEGGFGREMFEGAAGVFREVAGDQVLGKEKSGKRVRGKDVDDVAKTMAEGMERKRKKMD